MPHRLPAVLSAVAITALALTGCASPGTGTSATNAASTPSASGPLTVTNCDTTMTFPSAPKRVITIKSSSTEMLLALGLGDRIVGTAFQDGPVPTRWAAAAKNIPSLSEHVPSEEVALNTQPDMVFAGWESAFAADGVGTRSELQGLGVTSYVAPAACRSVQPPKLTFDDVFASIQQVADIFRVDPSPLLTEQKATLTKVTASRVGSSRTALWYSSGDATPYVGAGSGAPEMVMQAVGLKNIAATVDAAWAPLTWEAVVDANPDFIILIDATWNTAAKKITALEANPATANLTAVQHKRYLILPFAASEAGVRSVEAAASLAAQIKKLDGQ